MFCADNLSLFSFRKTRASDVPKEILGTEKIPGVLVVDRYAGYNRSPCKIQYCYEQLRRKLEDLGKENPKSKEVKEFVDTVVVVPLLVDAMKLRNKDISDEIYYEQTKELKEEILDNIRAPAKHLGIHTYQNIFIDNENRLFHWVDDRCVPAENNRAERELRPTVIARKVSFGS